MIDRVSLLVLGLGLLSGCGYTGKKLDPSVQPVLTDAVKNLSSRSGNPSPYAPIVALPQSNEEPQEPPPPSVAEQTPTTPPGPPAPTGTLTSAQQDPSHTVPKLFPDARAESGFPPIPTRSEAPAKATKPSKPKDLVLIAFECFREGKDAEGQGLLKKADPAVRGYLGVLLPLAAQLDRTCKAGKPGEYSVLLEALEGVARALRPRAALAVERMCYCRVQNGTFGIEKFGVYDPLPATHPFHVPGQGKPGDLVQLYLELRNFSSLEKGGFHETALACRLEILDSAGRQEWCQDRPAQLEQSRSPRRDAYLGCHFSVPEKLPAGKHTFCITVKDVTGLSSNEAVPAHRIARRSLPFHVRQPERLSEVSRAED